MLTAVAKKSRTQVRHRKVQSQSTPARVVWGSLNAAGEKEYPLHKGQWDVLNSRARFTAAIAGTGGGKTVIGPLWVAVRIKEILASRDCIAEPVLGFVVAPTYQILARATAPALVQCFKGTDLEGRYVPSQSRYYLPGGVGTIWLLGADNPLGLEGGQADFVWIDEGGQLKYDAWIALRGRTGQREAPILITTTPYGLNWLHKVVYQGWTSGDKDYYVRQWPSNANPAYSDTEYAKAKASMSPQRAAMRYDGQFMKMAGLVYPNLEECKVEHVDPPEGKKVGGLDWGWNSPFAAIGGTQYVNEYGDNILYIHYERYICRSSLARHAKAMPKGHLWWADPSEPSSRIELMKAGHRVRAANNRIIPGIDAVASRLFTGRLHISERCRALFGEAELYAYPEKDDEPYGDKPIDVNNHALDALRYLIMGIDQRKIANASAA